MNAIECLIVIAAVLVVGFFGWGIFDSIKQDKTIKEHKVAFCESLCDKDRASCYKYFGGF